ncbi:hypothetical protein THAOC_07138, partial [Thalassiosira oceanica]
HKKKSDNDARWMEQRRRVIDCKSLHGQRVDPTRRIGWRPTIGTPFHTAEYLGPNQPFIRGRSLPRRDAEYAESESGRPAIDRAQKTFPGRPRRTRRLSGHHLGSIAIVFSSGGEIDRRPRAGLISRHAMTAVAAAAPARVRTKSGRRGMKLASDALGDVREGRLFSPYDVDCVLDYFDEEVRLGPRVFQPYIRIEAQPSCAFRSSDGLLDKRPSLPEVHDRALPGASLAAPLRLPRPRALPPEPRSLDRGVGRELLLRVQRGHLPPPVGVQPPHGDRRRRQRPVLALAPVRAVRGNGMVRRGERTALRRRRGEPVHALHRAFPVHRPPGRQAQGRDQEEKGWDEGYFERSVEGRPVGGERSFPLQDEPHSFRFSPPTCNVLQGAWISDNNNELYYIVNIALCVLVAALLQVTTIEKAANSLYILWHYLVGKIAVVWYLIAYLLLKIGHEQLWMLVLGPICFMFPVGQPTSDSSLPFLGGISALIKSKADGARSCVGNGDSPSCVGNGDSLTNDSNESKERIVVTRCITCPGVSSMGKQLNLMMINCEEHLPYGPARQIALMFLELLSDCAQLRCKKAASGKEDGTIRIRITVYHAQRFDYPATEEDWASFDGILIPGSLSAAYDTHIEWIGHLMKVIQSEIVAKSRKTLGICFGHQAFAHSFGMGDCSEEAMQGRAAKCVLGPIAGRRVVPLTSQGQVFFGASCSSTTDNTTSAMLYTRGDMVQSIPTNVAVSLCGSKELPFEAVAYFSSNDDRQKFQSRLGCEDEPKPFAVTFQAHPEFSTCTGSNFNYPDCVKSMESHGMISNQVCLLAQSEAGEREKEITRSSLECTLAAANALGWFGGGLR